MPVLYDRIGTGYTARRRSDPRIAARIEAALGTAQRVLNVGAGAGSYEPTDRKVTAVEPSCEMIAQRRPDAAPVVQGQAEHLPFPDASFDAAMAVLTVHHWADQAKGLSEMRRVARGPVVILTFDPEHPRTWLDDYLPQLRELDRRQMPSMDVYDRCLGELAIMPVPIPHDCIDGFLYAFWRRPEAYLDPEVRAGISSFRALSDLEEGLAQLADDLASGAWHRQYAHILQLPEYDAGYRLIVSR